MLRRTLVGLVLLLVAVGCYLLDDHFAPGPGWFTAALGGLVMLGSLWELSNMAARRSAPWMVVGVVWLAAAVAGGLDPGPGPGWTGLALTAAAMAAGLVAASQIWWGTDDSTRRWCLGQPLFAVAYAGGIACLVLLSVAGSFRYAVAVVLVAKASDIGAYFVGRALGRHPLAPRISPKKTIEGGLGGVALSVGVAALLLTDLAWRPEQVVPGGAAGAALLGLVIGLVAVISDLSESRLKRVAGVKDSGRLFGEAGGWLDLADSLLLVGPFALAYTAALGTLLG